MKVIKPGSIPSSDIKHTCSYCSCEFLYSKEDIHIDQRDGNYVICPTCGKFINVGSGQNLYS